MKISGHPPEGYHRECLAPEKEQKLYETLGRSPLDRYSEFDIAGLSIRGHSNLRVGHDHS